MNAAALAGWRVLYVTPDQLRNGVALLLLMQALQPVLGAA
jgi:hypothetical protein